MSRTQRGTGGGISPQPRPVKKVDLKIKNWSVRLVIVIVLIVVAVIAIFFGLTGILRTDSGWQTISVNTSEDNCGSEFVFQYYLGASELSTGRELREVSNLYTEACEIAYRDFHADETFDGVKNVCYINAHPNEEIRVDDLLYSAFETMEDSGLRYLYLGPVNEDYNTLFFSNDDWEIADIDPWQNEEEAAYCALAASLGAQEEMIQLQLLGDNKVMLYVSEEYLAFAESYGTSRFLDFGWLKNAFIADYIADRLIDVGYSLGAISSYDGFYRSLGADVSYSFNINDCDGTEIYPAAVMEYAGGTGLVCMRSYEMSSLDIQHYYTLADGSVRTAYIDPADGLCRSALQNVVAYGNGLSCAEIALRLAPIYIADEFDEEALLALSRDGIYAIFCQDYVLCYNEKTLNLSDLYDEDGITYRTAYCGE